MKYNISPDRNTLTLECTPEGQALLREILNDRPGHLDFTSEDESEFLESLLCNSKLEWVDPTETGDLTDAPLLGIMGAEFSESSRDGVVFPSFHGWRQVGRWNCEDTGELENHYQPILERWGYPHYQVRSFLMDLMQTGKTEFLNAW